MGVYKLSANSVKNGRTIYGSMLAGNTAFLPTDFESIATVTVGSGGASNVEFTSIPSTYTHLQIRFITRFGSVAVFKTTFNSDNGSNYAWHEIQGNGTSVTANAGSSAAFMYGAYSNGFSATADTFGAGVIDVLDYANANKYKTLRMLSGYDANGSGGLQLNSGLWQSTSAITSIKITPNTSTFQQYSHFALYGIRSA
jgi:hypothetical protein